ncbi:hypothetical protein HYU82_02800 [Candidatus Saccharibacteria bacterium]|nr:hypothetical protein [Candidatus Saccharibacteria bacterium]
MFVNINKLRLLRLGEAQGASEERTETYLTYVEGVPQLVTPRFAKSAGGVPGYARQQAGAAHKS